MNERILIIEDDPAILKVLQRGLAYEGYTVDVATDGRTGLNLAHDHHPDLVILDWMLPGMDGLEVCRRLRLQGGLPILMLTAKDTIQDRVQGLDAGADDYIVKPFNLDELTARIRALFRRTQTERNQVYQFADLSMGWCVNCHRETKVQFADNKFYSIYTQFHEDIKNKKMDSVTVANIGGTECQKCHY